MVVQITQHIISRGRFSFIPVNLFAVYIECPHQHWQSLPHSSLSVSSLFFPPVSPVLLPVQVVSPSRTSVLF